MKPKLILTFGLDHFDGAGQGHLMAKILNFFPDGHQVPRLFGVRIFRGTPISNFDNRGVRCE